MQRNTVGYRNQMILEKGARIRALEENENGLIQCKKRESKQEIT